MTYDTDTIAAPITAAGNSVGIIRISGGGSLCVLKSIFKSKTKTFKTHRVYYGKISDKTLNAEIDEAIVTVMLAPKSFTKEDVVEINCHGGVKTVEAVLSLILKNGARLAEPGEFTKRAFLNGRIDLTRAEAVSDLISAKTGAAMRSAVNRLNGGLYRKLKEMSEMLLAVIARIEAAIDYPEHADELGNDTDTADTLARVVSMAEKLLQTYDTGRIINDGIKIVITGKPNVGKSSLLNALLNEERAIVTAVPGTTRDILCEHIDINGIPANIIDTAGLRETADAVEAIGVERAVQARETADLILHIIDEPAEVPVMPNLIVVINKTDAMNGARLDLIRAKLREHAHTAEISAKEHIGIETLKNKIARLFKTEIISHESTVITNRRHKTALETAAAHLNSALNALKSNIPDDLISIDLTAAYRTFGEITGETVTEDIIDKIFAKFCLGK